MKWHKISFNKTESIILRKRVTERGVQRHGGRGAWQGRKALDISKKNFPGNK
jgi:hypothetical protein